jgi:hypothetical protein
VVSPIPSLGKLRVAGLGEPAASNRRDSVGGLTRRGSNNRKRSSVDVVPPKSLGGNFVMPTIQADAGTVTQINVFTVPAGAQQALIDLLVESARFASSTPGWISASIHRSCDGTRVVNYAQSESAEAAERVIARLRDGGWLERNKTLGEAHPGLYEVVFTLER